MTRLTRDQIHEIIFEADTPAGKAFDIALLGAILLSVAAVMLESVDAIATRFGGPLRSIEWVLTILFTIEYVLRLGCVRRPIRYATSFYGLVDLLAIIPTYISILPIAEGATSLLMIRALRLLRVFRVLKIAHLLGEARELRAALAASRHKIFVFLWTILILVLILGSAMYLIEGPRNGFTSIPRSIYWTIVTMTTVGYGDITPQTVPGQMLASLIMIVGYGIIAVPTGIVTAELGAQRRGPVLTRSCQSCSAEIHQPDARFCRICGEPL